MQQLEEESQALKSFIKGTSSTIAQTQSADLGWVQRPITERIVDVQMPQVLKEVVEVVRLCQQERVRRRVAEHVVSVPFSSKKR